MTISYAWGPERESFSSQAGYVTLNSVVDNPGIGDERNFVRVREANKYTTRTDAVTVKDGGRYEVYIYFRNDAENVIATDVRVQSYFSRYVGAGQPGVVTAGVYSDNANPGLVWDSASFLTNSEKPLELRYVENSAVLHSNGAVNGTALAGLFTQSGTLVGYNNLDGVLMGGLQYAGYVTFEVEAMAVDMADYTAVYGEELGLGAVEPGEETTTQPEAPEAVTEENMPATGATGGGVAVAVIMGALVMLGWSLLRKIGNCDKISK